MLTIRTTTLLATIATTQAVDYFKASCTKVEAGTVFIDQFGNGKKTVVRKDGPILIILNMSPDRDLESLGHEKEESHVFRCLFSHSV